MNELLTKDEAYAVAEFIDSQLLEYIRYSNFDSTVWLWNVVHAYEKLKEYGDYTGIDEPCVKEIMQ